MEEEKYYPCDVVRFARVFNLYQEAKKRGGRDEENARELYEHFIPESVRKSLDKKFDLEVIMKRLERLKELS